MSSFQYHSVRDLLSNSKKRDAVDHPDWQPDDYPEPKLLNSDGAAGTRQSFQADDPTISQDIRALIRQAGQDKHGA